jgi:pantoate--beta-alanine ligase
MQIVNTKSELSVAVSKFKKSGRKVGFVPTMGNLHKGHLFLVSAAFDECDVVVVSIFVNPMQFGENEDLATYPRTPESDIEALSAMNVDLVYLPPVSDVYPGGLTNQTRVVVPGLSEILCGISRPQFFSGVATVVNRLFNFVQPDCAFFGRKDFQQLLVIRKMVRDLAMPVQVHAVEIVREEDGLAMSSRNAYLDSKQRQQAARLNQVLQRAAANYMEYDAITDLERDAREQLASYGFRVDYVEVRRSDDLGVPRAGDTRLIILAATWLGTTRLIDNMEFIANE